VNLAVHVTEGAEQVVVRLSGEFDLYSSTEVRDALNKEMNSGRRLLVDLADVSFIDSTALGVLLAAHRRALTNGSQLELVVDRTHEVPRALSITGLDRIFKIQTKPTRRERTPS
jgi:anti-sigma B factor antagonist